MMILKRRVLAGRLQTMLPAVVLGGLCLYAISPWLPLPRRATQPRTIIFYGFSILGEVMQQAIFPAFQAEWQARTGERVEFISAFAGSGTVTNQLIMGVPADLALLSLELDAQRLADAGVTSPQNWRNLPHHGVVNRTPFIILVRPGNPIGIHDFADLTRPGVRVVHPDPLTSGGANWAIVAEYGAGVREHPALGEQGGRDLLLGLWRNVVAQAASARAARTQFENGFGDALITYEQEALFDEARGKLQAEIIYPRSTILSEHTLVVIDRNVAPEERELVGAFVAFLWSEDAQHLFVEYGFRSVNEGLNEANPAFGRIADPFTIDDFGGWARARREIVDGVWKSQVLKELGR
ncbi:MAG: substrate-binding domain-containing protein [Ardenticatenaceae bacterium]|nr:substrate-binding domain-containing protein [Ardenticatenaceae bacterium]